MSGAPDDQLLAWLANENRILLTHDVQTMPRFVYERVTNNEAVVGVIAVHQNTPISVAVDEFEIMIGAGVLEDFQDQVKYIPVR
jgi:hypothetical protein